MKISKKTKKIVDQIYDPKYGWRDIKPVPLRRLWWKDRLNVMRYVTVVHFRELGDYKISELK